MTSTLFAVSTRKPEVAGSISPEFIRRCKAAAEARRKESK